MLINICSWNIIFSIILDGNLNQPAKNVLILVYSWTFRLQIWPDRSSRLLDPSNHSESQHCQIKKGGSWKARNYLLILQLSWILSLNFIISLQGGPKRQNTFSRIWEMMAAGGYTPHRSADHKLSRCFPAVGQVVSSWN